MKRRFVTLDVFTTQAQAGNPLAVVLDSDGLDTEAMQAITREFNLSETVFVAPPMQPRHRAALRIFTPGRELPFAGHPTVGTAVLLALRDAVEGKGADLLVLEEKAGLVPCAVSVDGPRSGHAVFTMPRLPQEIEAASSNTALAAVLGLDECEIGFGPHRAAVFSAGVPFTFVPLAGLDAIGRVKLDLSRWDAAMKPAEHPNAFVYCRQTVETGHHYHARMFWPGAGIAEDPATGGAAAAFAGVVMAFDKPADGEHRFVIEQGYEMGRPSQIALELTVESGALVSARIGGSAVLVSEGVLL
ncbi:PhzF family phenazine biosynthesis protein [Bosea psychrotolerans]|uniref:Trans-2,3-dihydro-3-hydroxyanthranilate isomerase n=1 Tax=Bosea psychrotolerans TaxID=1871628 RepID=A0A2S4MQX4_9HYPH|nr:PhzF family phenazine biosynthesis protein [Bosea psychrotolerans]POR57055.1 trans-2,3-dihydro-3-hydroxyanthranilate isomerase [Bosea psychrotolerans]